MDNIRLNYASRFVLLFFILFGVSVGLLEPDPATKVYEVEGRVGKEDTFFCPVDEGSSRGLQRRWTKDGQDIVDKDGDVLIMDRQTMEQKPRLELSADEVVFRALKLSDSGVYDCILTFGQSDQVILSRYRLTVRDVPNPPGTPRSQSISSRNITLIWQGPSDNNSPILHYVILVEPQTGKMDSGHEGYPAFEPAGVNDVTSMDQASAEARSRQRRIRTPDNGTTFTVTNLFPFTFYTFQLIAVNAVGHSRPSAISSPMQTITEPPTGSPVLIVAQSPSSSSIRLQWLPPSLTDWHGSLRGYRLFYRQAGNEQTHEIILDSPQAQTYEIRRLEAGKRFYISVQAFNEDGYSPAHTEVVSTQEAEPSAPRSVLSEGVTSSSISLAWLPPAQFNGVLRGYKIYYTHPAGFTDSKTFPLVQSESEDGAQAANEWVRYRLTAVQPFTVYQITVRAFTAQGEGPSNPNALSVLTDVAQPGSPQILNVSRVAENAVIVEWIPPRRVYKQLDFYYIQYTVEKEDGQLVDAEQLLHLPSSSNLLEQSGTQTRALNDDVLPKFPTEQAVITNLTTNRVYHIQVSAATKSIVDADKIYRSEPSLAFSMDLATHTAVAKRIAEGGREMTMTETVILIVVIVTIGLLSMFCGLFCAFRKRFNLGTYSYLAPNSPKHEEKLNGFAKSPTMESTALSSTQLSSHIKKLYADGQIGLSKEFESLATMLQVSEFPAGLVQASRPENRPKNRYVNVLAYDHSRVKLKHVWNCDSDHAQGGNETESTACGCTPRTQSSKTPVSDYINANFVASIDEPEAYIVTQAPMPNTLVDFWSMIWDYKVRVLIMLTGLEENGRKKCEQYWPSLEEGKKRYGPYSVTIVSEQTTAFYILRTFTVIFDGASGLSTVASLFGAEPKKETWTVLQYMYLDWPDHGRPDTTVPLLRFIMKYSQTFDEENTGPSIVHCSAGVGRSGCYIALHSMMMQLDRTRHVDVFSYLLNARKQRMGLVQNESQYALIYDALLEYIQSEQTEVYVATFDEYLDGLLKEEEKLLRRQHELVCAEPNGLGHACDYAKEPYNRTKNRSPHFLPIDSPRHRVTISPRPGEMGSDYINASFLPGQRHLKEFVVTQWPLQNTVAAFWQMIWDFQIRVVVLPDSTRLLNDTTSSFPKFWPDRTEELDTANTRFTFDSLSVHFQSDKAQSSLHTVECRIDKTTEPMATGKQSLLCQIVCLPEEHLTASYGEVFEMIDREVSHDGFRGSAPVRVAVVDEFGGVAAASFCGVMSARQQAFTEGSVDVYLTAKLYNQARPGVFSKFEDYKAFCQSVRNVCKDAAQCIPVEQLCFAGSILKPASPASGVLHASKRLSAILEQDE